MVTAPLVPDQEELEEEEEEMWDDISDGFDDWWDDYYDEDSWWDDDYDYGSSFNLDIQMVSDWFFLDNTEAVTLQFEISVDENEAYEYEVIPALPEFMYIDVESDALVVEENSYIGTFDLELYLMQGYEEDYWYAQFEFYQGGDIEESDVSGFDDLEEVEPEDLTLVVEGISIDQYGLVEIEFTYNLETKVALETVDFNQFLEVEVTGKLESYSYSWSVVSVVGKVLSIQIDFEGDTESLGFLKGGKEKVKVEFLKRSKFTAFLEEDEVTSVEWLYQTLLLRDKKAEVKIAMIIQQSRFLSLILQIRKRLRLKLPERS